MSSKTLSVGYLTLLRNQQGYVPPFMDGVSALVLNATQVAFSSCFVN